MQDVTSSLTHRPLLVRLCNWVGEVVLMVPALERLTQAGFDLTLYGRPWGRGLLAGYPWKYLVRPKRMGASIQTLLEWKSQFSQPVDALLYTKSLSSALETRLSGLKPHGYAYDGRSFLLHKHYKFSSYDHAADAYWDLTNHYLQESLPLPRPMHWQPAPEHQLEADHLLQQHGLLASNTVMLCPFSGADDKGGRKHWPLFAELAQKLMSEGQALLICPGPNEDQLAKDLYPKALRLSGVHLGVYGALMKRMGCVVANDTGPGHLAAAVGARLVSLYGPYSSFYWSPLGTQVTLFANPNHWPDLYTVHQSVRSLLDHPA